MDNKYKLKYIKRLNIELGRFMSHENIFNKTTQFRLQTRSTSTP